MSFFAKLKEIFNKNIDSGNIPDDHVIFRLNKKYVYLNKNILVRDDSACVIVYKNKVCDCLFAGKYKVIESNLPNTFARSSYAKLVKKGKKTGRIRVQLFFVNMREFRKFAFHSNTPFRLRKSELGAIKGCMKGECNMRVIDPAKLMRSILLQVKSFKNHIVIDTLGLWIGNTIDKKIGRTKIPLSALLIEHEQANKILNSELEDGYDNIGIFVKDIQLKAVDFKKKYHSKINEYMATNKRPIKTINFNHNSNISQTSTSAIVKNQTINESRMQNASTHSTMQTNNNSLNIGRFKICRQCKCSNVITAKICINCGAKTDY